MPHAKKSDTGRPVESYEHTDKQRLNNPPVGLVTPDTDPDGGPKTYQYDPHLDPQLTWAGKAEHTSFEVPTVSLHVHERIEPLTIIDAVRRPSDPDDDLQLPLFGKPEENPPVRDAVDFYHHPHGWSNRLVAGDSLLVMNSLLEKEGMAGKVQMVFIDPPYGIKYGSNFQPFVNKRDVKDGKDEDLTAEPEQIRAFRDTWELGIHSYLTYLRDRLLLTRELLCEEGSVFVQISDENVHHVRELLDEVFGPLNFCGEVVFRKTTGKGSALLDTTNDFLLWYAKNRETAKFRTLFFQRRITDDFNYRFVELPDGTRRQLTEAEYRGQADLPHGARVFSPNPLTSQTASATTVFEYPFEGAVYVPGKGGWKTNLEGMKLLDKANRLLGIGKTLRFVRYFDDFPYQEYNNIWDDTRQSGFGDPKIYVVQTFVKVIEHCILMTTDPGDIVFDPTCGSGTTAYVAEQWGRRWITCDTSRVAITLAKQRLMTAVYDYYELARPDEGIRSGFRYRTVPHITLKSIANNEPPATETLYDQPCVDKTRVRVSGPFTVEAVPAPTVRSVDDLLPYESEPESAPADASVARTGETLRQAEWRDELLRTGIRGKAGQRIRFSRLEVLPGCRYLHAEGETLPTTEGADAVKEASPATPGAPAYQPMRVVVSFGPEHAPLEQRQVALAIDEAASLVPRVKLLVFAAFRFDPEASKDIDETRWPGVSLLKAQMNDDLQTADLKKKRASNESFWLIGQPEVELECIGKGEHAGKYRVSVHGFDYYNTKTGLLESGSADRIAVWLLDTDYDGRSVYARQVFFPMAGDDEGWAKLARNLKAEVDSELIETYRGSVSLPFAAGKHKQIAVKIVDDRGIESLKVLRLD